jgi:uncharacterized protein
MKPSFPKPYLFFFCIVIGAWLYYMLTNQGFALYQSNWQAPLTMVFGSFIGGASSEGGGAVAFPVFTLLLNVPSATARNFSFAIQSIGMTAASLVIIGLKIPVSIQAIVHTSLAGVVGLLVGTFGIIQYLPGPETKLFFVSLWLSFGFALYLSNRNSTREVFTDFQHFQLKDQLIIYVFGFVGGIITAIFGNGIDIFTFCLFTLYYRISEKVATPTSVIIMTINTIIGFGLHFFVLKDFQPQAMHFWLCSIPVVIIFAPLGAYVISFFSRFVIAAFLYVIIVVQYLGALYVLKPSFTALAFSFLIILVGFLFFYMVGRKQAIS